MYVHAAACWRPANEITDALLDELGYTPTERRLQQKLGIRSRRTVLDLDYIRDSRNSDVREANAASTSTDRQAGAAAMRIALARCTLTERDIGLLIAGSSAPEYTCPAQACAVASELDFHCKTFDLSAACNTAIAQLYALDAMAMESLPDYVALLQIENVTRTVDYGDATTAALMGDCTTALVISKNVPSRVTIEVKGYNVDPLYWKAATIGRAGYFTQDSRQVRRLAREYLASESMNHPIRDGFVIPHQTSLAVLNDLRRELCIHDGRFLTNAENFGNCGAAGAVSVLAESWELLTQQKATATLLTIGAGMTWGSATVSFV